MRFINEDYSYRAASLVYTSLLSIVPLAIVSLTALSLIPGLAGAGQIIQDFIFKNFVAESASAILEYLQKFWEQTQHFSWITLFFLLIVCVFLILNIGHMFDTIWQVEKKRNYILSFIVYLLILVFAPIFIGLSILISTFLFSLPFISALNHIPYLQSSLLFLFPYLLTFIGFTLLNWLLPSTKVRLSAAALGGITSTILFELSKWGFAEYVQYSTTYKLLYGTLSILPMFLVWLYLCWVIVLFGGVVSHEFDKLFRSHAHTH